MSEPLVTPAISPKQRYRSTVGLGALLFWGLLVSSGSACGYENDSKTAKRLAELGREIATDYAEVTHITVADLKADYADALLVDVRATSEFERSHLPGALHAPTPDHVDELRRRYPDRDLVLYCTVGVRSSIAARDLLLRESTAYKGRVANLSGSIFAWANQGEPLENANGPTHDVHPFNAWWGFRYLDSKRPLPELPAANNAEPSTENYSPE